MEIDDILNIVKRYCCMTTNPHTYTRVYHDTVVRLASHS